MKIFKYQNPKPSGTEVEFELNQIELIRFNSIRFYDLYILVLVRYLQKLNRI